MKKAHRRQQGRGAFDIIEEATHLLRTAPPGTLALYFLGSVPFVLGLLFFWADMSRSPLAPQHLAGASLGVAALFFWMKFCQSVFARNVRAQAAGEKQTPLPLRHALRIFLTQTAIQASGLFILPVALICLLPFPWTYAFYQNATALDDGAESGNMALFKKCRRQAGLWQKQNYLLIVIMGAFGFCVFLNWLTVCGTLPHLLKMLVGVESDFTRSPMAMFNSTFFATMLGLTYLCVDPLLKTIYALRCFYGESLESGEDLKAELKPFAATILKIGAAVMIFTAALSASPVTAASTNAPVTILAKETIAPPNLDQTINQTIHESKYVWRMPREQAITESSKSNVVVEFIQKIGDLIRDFLRGIYHWIEKILRKLFHRSPGHVQSGSGYGWIMSLQVLLYGLIAAVIAALILIIYRVLSARRKGPVVVAGEAFQTTPDLADENVRADQLPEDGWTKLARELLEKGEFRLAMRAFYLASLAHLAARNLISIARFKSNRDYERELRRRAHAFPDLLAVFGDNVSLFERIWYGMYEANHELTTRFASNLERLKGSPTGNE